MANTRRSLAFSFAEKYSAVVIQFVTSVIVARILTPADIGIFSVGAAAIGIAHTLRDFGTSNYLIQEKELTPERIRTAFTVTLLIAWTVATLLFVLSQPIARFYDKAGVGQVLRVLALNFFLIPFSSLITALLRRNMEFGILYRVNVISAAISSLTVIFLAASGFGFMSLAWGALVNIAATVLIAIIYRPPQTEFRVSLQEFRRIFSFGSYASMTSMLWEIGLSAPDLLIGHMFGFSTLGFYSRASGLLSALDQIVISAIEPVFLPAFAAKHKVGEELKPAYLMTISYLTVIAWPSYIFLAFMAFPIIRFLYGNQWDNAAPLVQIISAAFAIRAMIVLSRAALTSIGEIRRNFQCQLILQPIFCLTIFTACFISLYAVAATQILFYLFYLLLIHRFFHSLLKITIFDMVLALNKSIRVSLVCMAALLGFLNIPGMMENHVGLVLAVAAVGYCVVWICSVIYFSHPLTEEIYRLINQLTFIKSR